jgi:DNA repair protein RadD
LKSLISCECKAEIVNPNDKLKAEFTRVKKDPYEKSTDKVLEWTATKSISRSGNDILVCEYRSQYRKFKIWYTPESKASEAVHAWRSLNKAVFSGHVAPDVDTFIRHISKGKQPETITCYRKRGTDFYKVIAHNLPEDTL